MMKSKTLLLNVLCFVLLQTLHGQTQKFFYTKGENNFATITMGSLRSAHCTVVEYPDFLVLHEIPKIPETPADSVKTTPRINPLLAFIDSVYAHKPIKYILSSHSHGHSLSAVEPFLQQGAKLVTTKESLQVFDKKGLFGNKTSADYAQSILQISADTLLLAKTNNPIHILHLKKTTYPSIPTPTYLFFSFPKQQLLAVSCMCSLKEFDEKKGYSGTVYSNRLVEVDKLITDKKLHVKNISQMYGFRHENEQRKLPIYSISYLREVLKNGWSREGLSEHLQQMNYEELTTQKDSLLNYLAQNSIYSAIVNHAVYELIEKKEYAKAVAMAQILVLYYPIDTNYIDTLGEAYFNNGELKMAKHYDRLLQRAKKAEEEMGLEIWEKNREERLGKKN